MTLFSSSCMSKKEILIMKANESQLCWFYFLWDVSLWFGFSHDPWWLNSYYSAIHIIILLVRVNRIDTSSILIASLQTTKQGNFKMSVEHQHLSDTYRTYYSYSTFKVIQIACQNRIRFLKVIKMTCWALKSCTVSQKT